MIESFSNPHLAIDAEQKALLDDDGPLDPDLPMRLHVGRKLPSLRIAKADLDRYGCTEGCPRCAHTQLGAVQHSNSNHWESCRRRVYQDMHKARDVKLPRWLREHPHDTAKVGPSVDLQPPTPGAASSAARVHDVEGDQGTVLPPPPVAPEDLVAFADAKESDFTSVVNVLTSHGVEPADAQRYVCSAVK